MRRLSSFLKHVQDLTSESLKKNKQKKTWWSYDKKNRGIKRVAGAAAAAVIIFSINFLYRPLKSTAVLKEKRKPAAVNKRNSFCVVKLNKAAVHRKNHSQIFMKLRRKNPQNQSASETEITARLMRKLIQTWETTLSPLPCL